MGNNRLFRTSLIHRNSLTAMAAGLLGVLSVLFRMRLDLAVPVLYWGDALYNTVLVKALAEGTWNYYIARLGAPFGMDAVDFPLGATLDFAVMKILTAIVHNPFLSNAAAAQAVMISPPPGSQFNDITVTFGSKTEFLQGLAVKLESDLLVVIDQPH